MDLVFCFHFENKSSQNIAVFFYKFNKLPALSHSVSFEKHIVL